MIGVFVTFRYESGFDADVLHEIAKNARGQFEGMPGLLHKIFTVDVGRREARNVYVWESEDAAKAFFSEETLHRVTGLYGIRPSVEYVQIAALVDNARKA
jgi:heme-degrading monooxygenase HmoA